MGKLAHTLLRQPLIGLVWTRKNFYQMPNLQMSSRNSNPIKSTNYHPSLIVISGNQMCTRIKNTTSTYKTTFSKSGKGFVTPDPSTVDCGPSGLQDSGSHQKVHTNKNSKNGTLGSRLVIDRRAYTRRTRETVQAHVSNNVAKNCKT